MKKFVVVHGVKGGVGKSFMASLIIDYEMRKIDKENILILEADGSVPDVGLRYQNIVKSKVSPILSGESAFEMVNNLEAVLTDNIETIILNAPANSEIIDACSEDVVEAIKTFGFEVRTAYMISESKSSAQLAKSSLDDGLVKYSDFAVGVVNKFFGESANKFYWMNSEERKLWLKQGVQESLLPDLPKSINSQLTRGDFFSKTLSSDLSVMDKIRLRKYLKQVEKTCEMILGYSFDSE